jgi:hypothetical protein
LDGNFAYDGCCNNDEDIAAKSLALDYDAQNDRALIYICGQEVPGGGANLILMATNNELANTFCQRCDHPQGSDPGTLLFDQGLGLLLCGNTEYNATLWRFSAADGVLQAAETLVVTGDPDAELLGLALFDGKLYGAGYAENNQGSWVGVSAAQTSLPRTWSNGSGLSSTADITLIDPPDDSVVDWLNPVIDTGGGQYDAMLTRRETP